MASPGASCSPDWGSSERRPGREWRNSLALAEYRLDHGEYPATLAALHPACLAKIPRDPFAGAPYHYRQASGGYVLYSIGLNGKDDGGPRDSEDCDDLGLTVSQR